MDKATEVNDLIGECPICKAPKPFELRGRNETRYINIACSSCGYVLSFVDDTLIKSMKAVGGFFAKFGRYRAT